MRAYCARLMVPFTRRPTVKSSGRRPNSIWSPLSFRRADQSRLKALQELDEGSGVDVRKAYDAIDQVLDVRQRAKFRVFEELMERRKLELVSRARQAVRPRGRL